MSFRSINLYNQLANNKTFKKSINFNLDRIKLLLKKLNNPERKLKNVINIIGSSGKYTTLHSLKNFIEADNKSVAAYISPSLKDIRERFWMGDRYLSYREIKKTIKEIEKFNIPLTTFEVLTACFVVEASKRKCDYNLIEAGALFAKDSTNIFDFPLAQVVTNINKQHLNFLKKKTIDEIINQKVGPLSNFTNIYIGKQKKSILKKIKKKLKNNKSKIYFSGLWKIKKRGKNFFFINKANKIKIISNNIKSQGLIENLGNAIQISLNLDIKKKTIQQTIPRIFFEGRFQYLLKGKIKNILHKNEKIMLDGAHSEADAINLVNYLKSLKLPIYGIWSMMKNKEPEKFIKVFKGIFEEIVTIPIENQENCLSSKYLCEVAKKSKFKVSAKTSFEEAIKSVTSSKKKLICVFGSLYSAGNVLTKN